MNNQITSLEQVFAVQPKPKEEPKVEQPPVDTEPKELFRIIRAAFSMRRKTLQNTLASAGIPKERTAAALEALGLSPSARGEELGLKEYAALVKELNKAAE